MIDSALSSNGHNSGNNDEIKKIENKRNDGVIRCKPQKIFPLADERIEDLTYPSVTYHYSVSRDARYVYVIGEGPELQSQLFVWDLHRGVARRYAIINLPPSLQMKHLYEINSLEGILVCFAIGCFHVYAIRFDHSQELIRIRKTLFYQLSDTSHFWSSARASSERGIIFLSQNDQIQNYYVAQISLDAPVQSVFLTAHMSGLRFCGQPWVHDNYMFLFESATTIIYPEMRYLTGRLVRANLNTGELDVVYTKAAGIIGNSLPAVQQQQQQQQQVEQQQPLPNAISQQMRSTTTLIRRVKHVGRNGWLWIIAEFVEPYDSLNQNTNRCEVCILEMQTFTWYRLNWLPKCKFDELTLDVTCHGTVVMLQKKILANQTQIDSFLLLYRNPETLLKQSFRALITYFPTWRNLNWEQMNSLGIPTHLLVP
ncbi:unnamed protein product [Onchocerca ochengi]|uniref:ELYS beta-propeller domain-containing protein n=2 Tax=Onchocerca TaxID=6281 RepID=A0A182E4A4_ONCOC|nr:unnamed protein product [Onchocerca ochengi]